MNITLKDLENFRKEEDIKRRKKTIIYTNKGVNKIAYQ